jgi:hypothetical protein
MEVLSFQYKFYGTIIFILMVALAASIMVGVIYIQSHRKMTNGDIIALTIPAILFMALMMSVSKETDIHKDAMVAVKSAYSTETATVYINNALITSESMFPDNFVIDKVDGNVVYIK